MIEKDGGSMGICVISIIRREDGTMKVFVTVSLMKGLFDEVKVLRSRKAAERVERMWLKEQGIFDEMVHEGKAQNGTESIDHHQERFEHEET